jgi:hypothetical protein
MVELFELIIAALGWLIYGSEEKPKHPIWRNTVRVIAFSGAAVFVAVMLGLAGNIQVPLIVSAFWFVCFMIVFSVEYYIGSVVIAYAAIATFALMALVIASTLM